MKRTFRVSTYPPPLLKPTPPRLRVRSARITSLPITTEARPSSRWVFESGCDRDASFRLTISRRSTPKLSDHDSRNTEGDGAGGNENKDGINAPQMAE